MNTYGGRRPGKSRAQEIAVEKALDEGKTVVFVSPKETILKRCRKHLTLHQTLRSGK